MAKNLEDIFQENLGREILFNIGEESAKRGEIDSVYTDCLLIKIGGGAPHDVYVPFYQIRWFSFPKKD